MRFMVIEHFKDADPVPVYRRFRERGRMLPEGVTYVASWIEAGFQRCFQVMECDDLTKLQEWMLNWRGIGEFEIVPVVTSAEAAKVVEPFLDQDG